MVLEIPTFVCSSIGRKIEKNDRYGLYDREDD
jgi:hypothetical protein